MNKLEGVSSAKAQKSILFKNNPSIFCCRWAKEQILKPWVQTWKMCDQSNVTQGNRIQ